MVYVRVDANETIATGHVMRCLAIAEKLKKRGETVVFILADDYPIKLIEEYGFHTLVLQTDWQKMESELEIFQKLIQKNHIQKLLIDSYQVTEKYLTKLHELTSIVYIDDLATFHYDVDHLINYNHYYKTIHYERKYKESSTKLWLGCNYIPLREEFQKIEEKKICCKIENIMITTGGTDPYHVCFLLAQKLAEKYSDINIHVVAGKFFDNVTCLKQLEKEKKNVILHQNINRMSDLMQKCDLAISAGGTTLYELCACGVPSICFCMADNQSLGVMEMAKEDIMLTAGDVRYSNEEFYDRILELVEKMKSKETRKLFSKQMQKLVDGKGAERIANIIMEI